jgi:RNA polymerase sigma-70 factor (ECF subfamily)
MTSMVLESESDLITRAQQGDRDAYAALVRCHYASVIRVIYRFCGDEHLAEDVAQEAFLKAWQHLSTYRPRSSFKNWLYRIAINTATDKLRSETWLAEQDVDEMDVPDSQPSPEALMESKERAAAVNKAIMSLPPASRSVLVLRELELFSYQEIADTLDIPTGTVMSRLNYGRERLRELLINELGKMEDVHA